MSQKMIAGPDASVTWLTGFGCKFNAFSINVNQSTMEGFGFGDTDPVVRGSGLNRGSGTLSGITTQGTTNDKPGPFSSGSLLGFSSASANAVFTFMTGCTLSMNVVVSGIGLTVQMEAFDQSSYSWVKDGPITETWVTS